jgi:hypothetical protein
MVSYMHHSSIIMTHSLNEVHAGGMETSHVGGRLLELPLGTWPCCGQPQSYTYVQRGFIL